jgi:hypothetical protein
MACAYEISKVTTHLDRPNGQGIVWFNSLHEARDAYRTKDKVEVGETYKGREQSLIKRALLKALYAKTAFDYRPDRKQG